MDHSATVTSFLSVLVGAAIAWIAIAMRERKERRTALGAALADLLEVRQQLAASDFLIQWARQHAVPVEAIPHVRAFFDELASHGSDLSNRYARAIAAVAGVDPTTAFELRSKYYVVLRLAKWRSIAINAGVNLAQVEHVESELRGALMSHINEALLRLARSYSWFTWLRVRRMTASQLKVPPEFERLLVLYTRDIPAILSKPNDPALTSQEGKAQTPGAADVAAPSGGTPPQAKSN